MTDIMLAAIVITAVISEYINGFHDTANAVAVTVHTGTMKPFHAVLMACIMNFAGAMAGNNVAMTIAKGILSDSADEKAVLCALISSVLWNLYTWARGVPSSSSHSLIGGLIGSYIIYDGSAEGILWTNVLKKIILPMILAPFIGYIAGYLTQRLVHTENRLLLAGAGFFTAFSHGCNDAQKTMGIITLALAGRGILCDNYTVPSEVKLICATALGLGTLSGGWRIIDTLGDKLVSLDKRKGLSAQISAALVIQSASFFGMPVSTTQIVTSCIAGTGRGVFKDADKAREIVLIWLFTLPVSMITGALTALII